MIKRQKADEENQNMSNYQGVDGDGIVRQVVDEVKENDAPAPVQETHMRSILKGITWRLVASFTTITIAWYITGQVGLALEIGFIEIFAKLIIYYIHERIWARIRV
jgi:uncharacterized membrane protein